MVLSCCAHGCKETFIKGGSITFHSFPKDPLRRKIWTKNIRRKDFIPTDYTKICSKHFEEKCFDREKFGGRWLKSTAVPTLFNFTPHLHFIVIPKKTSKRKLCSKRVPAQICKCKDETHKSPEVNTTKTKLKKKSEITEEKVLS